MLELLLLLALVILVVVIVRTGMHKMILGFLDGHAAKVRAELEEARRLREEAQALLAAEQAKLTEGRSHAEAIAAQSGKEIERMMEHHRADLEAAIARRTQQAMTRIAQDEAQALAELRQRAATLAIQTTRQLFQTKLEGDQGKALLDSAIAEVGRKLA